MKIAGREIGQGKPVFIVAEMSANHGQEWNQAVKLVQIAKECGADAVKVQCFTPETMCSKDGPPIQAGTKWDGRTLWDLYSEAYMPWDWIPKLQKLAEELGIILFSTVYDKTSVDWLEKYAPMPAYKIASFELTALELLEYVYSKNKPVILSTGMATSSEMWNALNVESSSMPEVALLKCTSTYPAQLDEMNLSTIPRMRNIFYEIPIGLSDHSMNPLVSPLAVALGACIIEAHLQTGEIETLDSAFSWEPPEFRMLVKSIRETEQALGTPFAVVEREQAMRAYRRIEGKRGA